MTAALPDPSTVQEVITLGHLQQNNYEQLGFSVIDEPLDLLGSAFGGSSLPSSSQPAARIEPRAVPADDQMAPAQGAPDEAQFDHEAPIAPDEPAEEQVAAGPEEIIMDGTRINSASPLVVLKAACTALGLPQNGSRAQLFKRVVQHLQHQELLAAHSVKHNLSKDLQRPVELPPVPEQPTDEEVREHNATHIPYKAWCELCVAHKGRQDHPHRESHTSSSASVVSFDFGFVDRGGDETLTAHFIHDRSTKTMHAVPTAAKGGKSLPYLSQELCRFITWLGHQEVCLRTDNEPRTLSLLEAARKALKGLGVHVTVETVVPGNKEGSGAAEITVQTIRNQANLLIEQVERALGADGKVLFSALHPLYAWALLHASWLHCRYAVANGETSYERCTGREYHGKICLFGEVCMGYLKPSAKGLASWHRGVWLGKTLTSDGHIISCNGGLFITRSVRRIPTPWISSELERVEMLPWECSFATLGSRLMVPKRVLKPPVRVVPALPPGSAQPERSNLQPVHDEEAEAVRGIPPTPMEQLPDQPGPAGLEVSAPSAPPQAGIEMMPPPPTAISSGLATPMDLGDDVGPSQEPTEDEHASKRPRICVVAGVEYEHEDDHNYTSFTNVELDDLEEFDFGFDAKDDSADAAAIEDSLFQQLIFPYGEQEPKLSDDELFHLDSVAKQVETTRLKAMGVLLPPESVEGLNPKKLSTRFVVTWRDKVLDGRRCWLRRARYVAREYAWLTPDRQDLFSPASSNVTNRLLPSLFLHWKRENPHKKFMLGAIDVPQVEPTLVSSGEETFALGRVLPGQRDGSQLWFNSVSSFLGTELGFKHCDAYASLLGNEHCLILLHVDDMLVLAEQQYFDNKLLPTLTAKYKVSSHCMTQPGDSFEFLKRIHSMIDEDTIHIQQNPRHFDKLFDVMGISGSSHAKKVPCHEMINEPDTTSLLSAEKASKFRSAVGVLLYLACDLVECSYTIRGLAQYMSSPTERSWMMLRHLCLYLTKVRNNSLRLRAAENGLWHSPASDKGVVLEMFTDSDWAAHKGHRRSVSSGMIFFEGCLLLATSRTQRIVALSSAEAEIHAAVSATCDGILLKTCIQFCLGRPVRLKLILDNSAAKQVMQRSGVGRIRHLSCRILWIQDHVKRDLLETASIPTKENYADLGTKKLSLDRMHYLMHGIGVFDEDAGELVGVEVVQREKSKQEFKSVLRVLCDSTGGRSRDSVRSTKHALKLLLLTMLVDSTDALSLPTNVSPMVSVFWPCLEGLSFWMFAVSIIVCICAVVFMMPIHVGDSVEPDPEAESSHVNPGSAVTFNSEAAYCFLALCIGHTLRLLVDAEFDQDRAKEDQLNQIYDAFENVFTLFEADSVSADSLQTMLQIHGTLQGCDSSFNAFDLLDISTESDFHAPAGEPEAESYLAPDPPADFDVNEIAGPYEPGSPEDMAQWMVLRISQRLKPAMLEGLSSKVQKHVARRQIMRNLIKYCDENPEKRSEIWSMMQTIDDISGSEDEDA